MTRRYALGQAGTQASTRRLTGVVGTRPAEDPEREAPRGEMVLDNVGHPGLLLGHPEILGWASCHGCGRQGYLLDLLAEQEEGPPGLVPVAWCLYCFIGELGMGWAVAAWPTGHPQFARGWQGVERPLGSRPPAGSTHRV